VRVALPVSGNLHFAIFIPIFLIKDLPGIRVILDRFPGTFEGTGKEGEK